MGWKRYRSFGSAVISIGDRIENVRLVVVPRFLDTRLSVNVDGFVLLPLDGSQERVWADLKTCSLLHIRI